MSKNYFRSDLSVEEAIYFTQGYPFLGLANHITDLFKFIVKYDELEQNGEENNIVDYNPQEDKKFKYENRGYSIIGNQIKKQKFISRKYLKSLSRKWSFRRVVLSFDSDFILSEIYRYIEEREILRSACLSFWKTYNTNNWFKIMPVQYSFLSKRFNDHHKNWKEAERIINALTQIVLQ